MKIFVSICSYRDPLLVYTLKALIERKSALTECTFGIFEQNEKEASLEVLYPELATRPDVRYKRIDPEFSEGVCWARHINSLQMTNEDFYYQVDSHMVFDHCWDRQLINDYIEGTKLAETNKVIISSNCKNFTVNEGEIILENVLDVACSAKFYQFSPNFWLYAHGVSIEPTKTVTPAIHLFAGNFFTHSDWLYDVGINPRIYFHGEEQVMTLSSFAAGYAMYHGTKIQCYHYKGSNQHTSKQNYQPVVSEQILAERQFKSDVEFKRFLDSLGDDVLNAYKLYSGVDYINRKLEQRAITRTYEPSIENDWEIP